MTTRTMSPTAAQAHARRAIRQRMKNMRENKRVDPPQVFADRLSAYAAATAAAFPSAPSKAYRQHVEAQFHYKFLELCRTTPVEARLR